MLWGVSLMDSMLELNCDWERFGVLSVTLR